MYLLAFITTEKQKFSTQCLGNTSAYTLHCGWLILFKECPVTFSNLNRKQCVKKEDIRVDLRPLINPTAASWTGSVTVGSSRAFF